MSTIGNIIWILLGGIWMSLGWVVAGVIMYVTVVGIPWGRSCFVIARFTLFPFGHEAVSRRQVTGEDDLGTGTAGMVGNVVWLLLAGWWLALGHLATGLIVCLTVIGIPFGIQHFKLLDACGQEIGGLRWEPPAYFWQRENLR